MNASQIAATLAHLIDPLTAQPYAHERNIQNIVFSGGKLVCTVALPYPCASLHPAIKAQIESWKGEIALHRRRAELAAGEIARIRPEFETNARLAESTKAELERQRQTARALQLEASFKRSGHGQE